MSAPGGPCRAACSEAVGAPIVAVMLVSPWASRGGSRVSPSGGSDAVAGPGPGPAREGSTTGGLVTDFPWWARVAEATPLPTIVRTANQIGGNLPERGARAVVGSADLSHPRVAGVTKPGKKTNNYL